MLTSRVYWPLVAVLLAVTLCSAAPPTPSAATGGMVWVPLGQFTMGSNHPLGRLDELPMHPVRVDGFWIDRTEVTNAQFARFVDETGYSTTAERAPTLEEIMAQVPPGTTPPKQEDLVAASLVFTPTRGPVPLGDAAVWWRWVPDADWRHPEGPDSSIVGKENHPVVQVSWFDAQAYADWAGKRLPTETEWERAARGGLDAKAFTWGDAPLSAKEPQVNIWQGRFPYENTAEDGYPRTAPVGSYPPNGFGLVDMGGNVWEWTADWYRPDTYARRVANLKQQGKQIAENPASPKQGFNPQNPRMPERTQRGGSFLCSDSYCASYRPAARMHCSPDTSLSHTGFRCVMSPLTKQNQATDTLRVMTFNLRFGTAPDGENHWDHRQGMVLDTIREFAPDLLGTQEMLPSQRDALLEGLDGYRALAAGRDDGAEKGEMSGILYREAVLEVLDWGTRWLCDTPDQPGTLSWEADYARVFTWAHFRFRSRDDAPIYVINTHWDHVSTLSRAKSAAAIADWIAEHAPPGSHVLVTGDFNCPPESEPIRTLKQRAGLRNALDAPKSESPKLSTFNAFRPVPAGGFSEEGRRIDMILCAPGWKVDSARVDSHAVDGHYPSDHFPVTAVLRQEPRDEE